MISTISTLPGAYICISLTATFWLLLIFIYIYIYLYIYTYLYSIDNMHLFAGVSIYTLRKEIINLSWFVNKQSFLVVVNFQLQFQFFSLNYIPTPESKGKIFRLPMESKHRPLKNLSRLNMLTNLTQIKTSAEPREQWFSITIWGQRKCLYFLHRR